MIWTRVFSEEGRRTHEEEEEADQLLARPGSHRERISGSKTVSCQQCHGLQRCWEGKDRGFFAFSPLLQKHNELLAFSSSWLTPIPLCLESPLLSEAEDIYCCFCCFIFSNVAILSPGSLKDKGAEGNICGVFPTCSALGRLKRQWTHLNSNDLGKRKRWDCQGRSITRLSLHAESLHIALWAAENENPCLAPPVAVGHVGSNRLHEWKALSEGCLLFLSQKVEPTAYPTWRLPWMYLFTVTSFLWNSAANSEISIISPYNLSPRSLIFRVKNNLLEKRGCVIYLWETHKA